MTYPASLPISAPDSAVSFPAGRYLIGDLCYRDDEMWDVISSVSFGKKGRVDNFYEGTEHTFCILNTKYGDGSYEDNEESTYYVDSGTIGIMSWDKGSSLSSTSGRVFDFPEEFKVYSDDGVLHFGHIVIDTKGESDYDDE